MKDTEIIHEILAGNHNQFGLLMEKYHHELFKYIYNMTGQVQDTEDLLQDIFLKVYHKLSMYNASKASFRTWLYRIATNESYNYFKSRSYQTHQTQVIYDDQINQAEEDVEATLVKSNEIEAVLQAIKQTLKPKARQIMLLHFFSGLTVKEISSVMNIPIKTIYKSLKSSIKKLQKEVTLSDEIES